MSHQRLFLRPGFCLIAFFLTSFYSSIACAATAQSSATVSWATAFSGSNQAFTSYAAGEDFLTLGPPVSFEIAPSNSAPQGVSYGDLDNGSGALADSSLLSAESYATNGSAAVDVSLTAVFLFEGMGSGLLNIQVPYTLSTLVQPSVGSSTVSIFASLGIVDFTGATTVVGPEPSASLDDSGLGSPNELTGMLSLQFAFNENIDLAGVLSINVQSESSATPAPLQQVPIPGGIALAIPALLPLFASRSKRRRRQTS